MNGLRKEVILNITYALMFASVLLGLYGFFHWMNSLGATPYILNGLIGLVAILLVGFILNWFGSIIRRIVQDSKKDSK